MQVDPSINYFAVVHERLGSNDDSAGDDEVMDRILYYYPFEANNDERLSKLKFIESMIATGLKFSKNSNNGIKTVTMKKSTIGFIEVEQDCWFVISILNDGGINKNIMNLRPQLFIHRPNSQSIISAMKHLYSMFTITNGSISSLLSGEDDDGWEHIETVRIARKRCRKLEKLLDEELLQEDQESKRVKELQNEMNELINEIHIMIHSQELALYTPLMISNLLKSYLDWFLLNGEMSTPNITHCMIGYHKADSSITVMKRLESIRNSLTMKDNINDNSSSPFTGSIMVLFDGTLLNSDFPVSTTTSLCSLCRMLDESKIRNAFSVQPWIDTAPMILKEGKNLDSDCNDSNSNQKQSIRRKSIVVQSSNNPKRGSEAKASGFFRRRSTSSVGTHEFGISSGGDIVFGNANNNSNSTTDGNATNNNMSKRPQVVRYDAKNAMEGFAAWTVGYEESIGFLTPNWKCADFSNIKTQFQTPDASPVAPSGSGSGSKSSMIVDSEVRIKMNNNKSSTSTPPHKVYSSADGQDNDSVSLDSELQTIDFTRPPLEYYRKQKSTKKTNINNKSSSSSNLNNAQVKWPFTLWCPKLHSIHDMKVSNIGHALCYRKGKFLLFMQLKLNVRPTDAFVSWTNICKSTHDMLNKELDLLYEDLTEVHHETDQPSFCFDLNENPSNINTSNEDTHVEKDGSKSSSIVPSRRLSQKIVVNAMQERHQEEVVSPKSSIFNLNIFGSSAQPKFKTKDIQNKSHSRIIFSDAHLGIYRASNIIQDKGGARGRNNRSASFTGTSAMSSSVASALRAPHPIINWPHAAHLPLHYNYYQNEHEINSDTNTNTNTNIDFKSNTLWSPGSEGGSSINNNKDKGTPNLLAEFDAQSPGEEVIIPPKPNGGFGFITPDLNNNVTRGATVDDGCSVSFSSISVAINGIGTTSPVRVEYGAEVEKLLRIRPKYPHCSGFIGSNIEPILLVAITDIHTQLKTGAKEAFSRVTTTKRGAVWAYGRIPRSTFSSSTSPVSTSTSEQQSNKIGVGNDSLRDSSMSNGHSCSGGSSSSVEGSDQQMCLFLVDNAPKVLDLFRTVSAEMQLMLI